MISKVRLSVIDIVSYNIQYTKDWLKPEKIPSYI